MLRGATPFKFKIYQILSQRTILVKPISALANYLLSHIGQMRMPLLANAVHPAHTVHQFTGFRVDRWIGQAAVVTVAFDCGLAPAEQQPQVFGIRQPADVEQARFLTLALGF